LLPTPGIATGPDDEPVRRFEKGHLKEGDEWGSKKDHVDANKQYVGVVSVIMTNTFLGGESEETRGHVSGMILKMGRSKDWGDIGVSLSVWV